MSEYRYIQQDESGHFHFNGDPINDSHLGQSLIENIYYDDSLMQWGTEVQSTPALIECFDEPLVAQNIDIEKQELILPYGSTCSFDPKSFCIDDWDRFHGINQKGIQFVLSRAAQAELFNRLDEFDDDSITLKGQKIPVRHMFPDADHLGASDHWTGIYQEATKEGRHPGWEMHQANPILKDVLPQLKLPKCRILVLGGGTGNDGAFFAEQGHFVTSIDFSDEAHSRAQEKYGHIKNLKLVKEDIFNLSDEHFGQYDLVFEHTCYCAINPQQRSRLVQLWTKCLADGGHFLGIFFIFPRANEKPFGASEWEIRQRLAKSYDTLYWTRWKKSEGIRTAKELIVFARKKLS